MESFEPMVTKLCSGQYMLHKINQRGIIQKRNKGELRFLFTALRVIARSMHTNVGIIWTYDAKLRYGQGKRDDANDQSNTYMSPSQATQKN